MTAATETARGAPPACLPSVSVVVPCYNYSAYLRECVESVLGQDGIALRVLIIDDASTDDSAGVAAQLAAADPRVEWRRHAVNVGHIGTYNEGLEWATATYTVVLGADDLLAPGALRRACALMEAHPNVVFVYGHTLVFHDDHARPQPRSGPASWKIWSGQKWFQMRCRMAENCIYSSEVLVRSELLHRLGGYRVELPHAGDLELWMRLSLYGDVGYISGPDQACYRDHAMGMHRQQFGTVLADLMQVRAAFEMVFKEHGAVIGDRARLEALVRLMLARRALGAACRLYDRGLANPAAVGALEEFARATYAGAGDLSELRGLRRRRQLGPRLSWLLRPFTIMTAQRAYRTLHRRRLARMGLCLQRAAR